MAFINNSKQQSDKKIILEVVTPQEDGTQKVNKYVLNRLKKNEIISSTLQAKGDNEMIGKSVLGKLFDTGEPIEGKETVYELIESFDEETSDEFLQYILALSKKSIVRLIDEGIELV